MTFREATHQVQVLALDVAILWQLAYKPLDRRQQLWRQDSDDMSPLLRAHCEWPGGHGAADQRDECASLHVLPPRGKHPTTSRCRVVQHSKGDRRMVEMGHEHASRVPSRDGESASVTGRNRRSAA